MLRLKTMRRLVLKWLDFHSIYGETNFNFLIAFNSIVNFGSNRYEVKHVLSFVGGSGWEFIWNIVRCSRNYLLWFNFLVWRTLGSSATSRYWRVGFEITRLGAVFLVLWCGNSRTALWWSFWDESVCCLSGSIVFQLPERRCPFDLSYWSVRVALIFEVIDSRIALPNKMQKLLDTTRRRVISPFLLSTNSYIAIVCSKECKVSLVAWCQPDWNVELQSRLRNLCLD